MTQDSLIAELTPPADACQADGCYIERADRAVVL
eukprot:CAMPEP_0113721184 /NCGR_PEP_ID=MMETSP0038_2-20120614/36965_1 /TAXON_ID=2898 /ORGANISM="Cryptomonas paramecium" /LENGTH=33 /DNA_ID=CAMNT_0000650111 /DNA_START=99 /DNA_END=197 /DNA_ORIENTATION=- /assembly_acc=CAM_ASM_000170